MKKLILSAVAAFVSLGLGAADWKLNATAKTITEQGASGNPWVFNVTISGTDLALGQVNTQGSDGTVDLTGSITDDDAGVYQIKTIPSFKGQTKATFTRFLMPDTVTDIPSGAFNGRTALTEVRLSANLETIGGMAFYSASGLTNVWPRFPAKLKTVGKQAFATSASTKAKGDAVLSCPDMTEIYGSNPGVYSGFNFSSVDMSQSGIASIGDRAFYGMSLLGDIKFSPSLKTLNTFYAFYGCKALTNLVFASLPTDLYAALTTKNYGFASSGVTSYSIRFMYCPTLGDWNSFIENDLTTNGMFTAWGTETVGNQNKYWAKFGADAPTPTGSFEITGTTRAWLVKYTVETKTVNVNVTGNVLATGEGFTNGYGEYEDVTCPFNCAAPEYAYLSGVAYRRTGWVLEKCTDDGYVKIDSGETGTCSVDVTESGTYRLTWQWTPHAYSLTLTPVPSSLGSMTVTPPNFQEAYYTSGTQVSLAVTPAAGVTFAGWLGDIDEASKASASICVTMNGNRKLIPYLKGPWWYDETAHVVSNGYWTFSTTGSADALTVSAVKTAGDVPFVDFSTGIDGEGAFAGIGASVFVQSAAIEECVMSDTMTTLGDSAFREATNLRRVVLSKNLVTISPHCFRSSSVREITPFLPASVKTVGYAAFSSAASLTGDLVMPKDAATTLEEAPSSNQFGLFYGTKLDSADLSGLSITNVAAQHFRGGGTLTNVVFGAELKTIADYSFYYGFGATATVRFKGGPVRIGGDHVFSGLGSLTSRYIVPRNKGWEEYLADTEKGCALTALTDGEKTAYATKFPGSTAKFKAKLPSDTRMQYLVYDGASGLAIFLR